MKKIIFGVSLIAFCCAPCLLATAMAADKGPAEITLESTIDGNAKPKPAFLPHGEHQSRLECGTCHHGKDADGKQVAYVEGQKVEKCESCHNTGEAAMSAKLNTFKKAAHKKCTTCHRKIDKKLASCKTCHK
ncbi:cytochrome c3 family protein [Desulfobulbus rhabdoformis]|uniref:cytochrome c3 family protein n=1 Tax=Desulfobulbus rhabdoformis TaxID=34032 RepID=UPI001964DB74|nr:cytochrome c3 family protein [Desulfobulbus rhabdoformis]MBM9613905.1 cytochrome c3 family protein [Desulfobulbus rhabdoformis]